MNIEEFVRHRQNRVRVHFSHSHQVQAAPDKIFPLLCPTREYEWIDNWQCDLIYSKSGFAEAFGVFTTEYPHDGGLDVWVVSRYEPDRHIQFVRVNPQRAMIYDVILVDNGQGTTTLTWQQTITGLNDSGDDFVNKLREENFINLIDRLGQLLDHYLKTGSMLLSEQRHA